MAQQPLWAKAASLLIMITQNDTPESVGLLWTSDQP